MKSLPNFPIQASGTVSSALRKRGITTFCEAMNYLARLPYGCSAKVHDLKLLIESQCSFTARHALLVQVAQEQQVSGITLVLCAYNLADCYSWINPILRHHQLPSLPEIDACLQYEDQILTLETPDHCPNQEIISAIEIAPVQIGNFKRRYHQNYIEHWLQIEGLDHRWTVAQVWDIREECLQAIEQRITQEAHSSSMATA